MIDYRPWWALWVIGMLSLSISFAWNFPVYSRELYKDQYAQIDPKTRDWFKSQKSPKTGAICCSEADGEMVEEDIRNGEYWIKSAKTMMFARFNQLKDGNQDGWVRVPADVIIKEPNLYGRPVAWYVIQNAMLEIRCFSPGSLL
jgi:hypothetical protein